MPSLPILFISVTTRVHRALRAFAYREMRLIVGSWLPASQTEECGNRTDQAIRIDFDMPRAHRLTWASRRIGQMPY